MSAVIRPAFTLVSPDEDVQYVLRPRADNGLVTVAFRSVRGGAGGAYQTYPVPPDEARLIWRRLVRLGFTKR